MRRKMQENSQRLISAEYKVSRRRRERHEIIMEILKIATNGTRKTKIMENVGLSGIQLKEYMNSLKKAEFISEKSGIWKTTEKGLQVIEACKICHALVKKAT